jgi:hypothetical protein
MLPKSTFISPVSTDVVVTAVSAGCVCIRTLIARARTRTNVPTDTVVEASGGSVSTAAHLHHDVSANTRTQCTTHARHQVACLLHRQRATRHASACDEVTAHKETANARKAQQPHSPSCWTITVRVCDCSPLPHGTEQSLHADHSDSCTPALTAHSLARARNTHTHT